MREPFPRELEHSVEQLKTEQTSADGPDVTVEWRGAEPETRPTGMSYDVDETEGAAVLAYDAWDAQQDALEELADEVEQLKADREDY